MAAFLERLQSAVPQGQVLDASVTTVEHRDWRGHFAGRLHGRGLELGPLHRPLKPHAGMRMTYMDRADQETLKREFPAVAKRHRPGRRHRRRRDARHRRRRQLRLPDRGARHRAHAQPDRRARQLAARRPRRRARLPDRARQAPDLRPAARPHDARAHGARLPAAVARARLRALPRLRGVRAPRHDRPGHRRGDAAARCRLQHPFPRLSPAGRRAARRVDPRSRDPGPRGGRPGAQPGRSTSSTCSCERVPRHDPTRLSRRRRFCPAGARRRGGAGLGPGPARRHRVAAVPRHAHPHRRHRRRHCPRR